MAEPLPAHRRRRSLLMHYLSHSPAPPLSAYIENMWFLEDLPSHAMERIVPSGTVELVVNLREDEIRLYDVASGRLVRYSGAVVSGAYGRFFVIDSRQHASIMGVHFRAGGAWPFLGVPAGELADAHVDLETFWGRRARDLRERLCAAATPGRRFEIMERVLSVRLSVSPQGHGAVPVALRALGRGEASVPVREVARRIGLSQRRLIEVFRAEVGMTPKLYSRVRRFQRALAAARAAPRADWAALASDCGYFDQSHLIHDFREFCGLGPTSCLRNLRVPVKENHVPLIG